MVLILVIFAGGFALWAAIAQHIENSRLSEELYRSVAGAKTVPKITSSLIDRNVIISITNTDTLYPLLNVKVKCRETFLPDIGTLYPTVSHDLITLSLSPDRKEEIWYFVIWYNNTKSVVVDLILVRDEKGNIKSTIKYLDGEDNEFMPEFIEPRKNVKNTFNPHRHS